MRINQQSTIQQNKRNRRLAFIGLIAVQVISAVLDIVFYERKQYHLFFTVAEGFFFLWLLLIWCTFDSKIRRYSFKRKNGWWIILLTPIGLLLYFWQSRSRGEFLKNLGGLYLLIVPFLAYYIAALITVLILQAIGYYS